MKARNSLLESVWLSPSRPAYRWKTASRDSMQRSVSVGCGRKSAFRPALRGAAGSRKRNLTLFLEKGWAGGLGGGGLTIAFLLLCPTCPAAFFCAINFSDRLAREGPGGLGSGSWKNPWGDVSSHQRSVLDWEELTLAAIAATCSFFPCSPARLGWKDKALLPLSFPLPCLHGGETLSHERKMRAESAPQIPASGQGRSRAGLGSSALGMDRAR